MPGARDKVIINGGRDSGNHKQIMSRIKILKKLGKEVVRLDLLKEAQAVRAKMVTDCSVFNQAQTAYCAKLDARIDELDALINSASGLP